MSRPVFWVGAVAAFWAVEALFWTLQSRYFFRGAGVPFSFGDELGVNLVASLLMVPPTLMVLWLSDRWPLGSGAWNVVVHIAGFAVTVVSRAAALVALNDTIGWYTDVPPWGQMLHRTAENTAVTYGLVVFSAHAVHYAREHQRQKELAARAELQLLRAQVRPHFIFNALNTIASQVHHDPDVADRMIVGLGTLLRRSLDHDDAMEVPLRDEIELARAYLDIEQARFEDRLEVEWNMESAAQDALVPSLLLQPLVENAVRHGLAPRAAPGRLCISGRRRGSEVLLSVEDDGIGLPRQVIEGIGLATVRAKLARLYGPRQSFLLEPRPGGGAAATVVLPYRRGADERLDDPRADR